MTQYLENKKQPLISVIMSEYSTPDAILTRSIQSILDQTYENLEIILVDDSREQNLRQRLSAFSDTRLKIIQNGKNRGFTYSLNSALNEAKGEYVARMDTDDYSLKNRIEKQFFFMTTHPQYSLVSCRAINYNETEELGTTTFYGDVTKEQLIKGNPIIHPGVMCKKRCLKAIGGYVDYNRCEDYATWIELYVHNYKMYVMEEALIKYHLSLSDYKKRTITQRKGFYKLLKKQYNKLNPTPLQKVRIFLKTTIAGILPQKMVYNHHKRNMNGIQK